MARYKIETPERIPKRQARYTNNFPYEDLEVGQAFWVPYSASYMFFYRKKMREKHPDRDWTHHAQYRSFGAGVWTECKRFTGTLGTLVVRIM